MHILVQSIPQLEEKWGTAGARAILTNATYITFGGSKDSQSAKGIVDVLGEWREQLIDRDGKKDIEAFEWRYRPWATASDLNRMRKFEVVVLRFTCFKATHSLGTGDVGRLRTSAITLQRYLWQVPRKRRKL